MERIELLGYRLKQLREEYGYSGESLAAEIRKRFGLKARQSHISNIENNPGEKLPSVPVLVALATILETSTDYLLGLTDNALPAVDWDAMTGQDTEPSEELRQLWGVYQRLSPSHRQDMLTMARALGEQERQVARFADLDEYQALYDELEQEFGEEEADRIAEVLRSRSSGAFPGEVTAPPTPAHEEEET